MSTTRTGAFTIGFRRGGGWQADLGALIAWAKENDFGALDLGADSDKVGSQAIDAGLRLGSVDLPNWQGMLSPDADKRAAAVAQNTAYIEACAPLGKMNHFTVMLPEDQALPRSENFEFMVRSFTDLTPALEANDANIVIEGWPGPGALCCTPETYRAFFTECPSPNIGVNYDPSHLIRMGIDHIRFLKEFATRVHHVHAKDTELMSERLYEYGNLQPATFVDAFVCGEQCWRYAIPGQGEARWSEIFRILQGVGYEGCVCVELEDSEFMASEEDQKQGLTLGRRFLEGA